jgi:hypothetical protein
MEETIESLVARHHPPKHFDDLSKHIMREDLFLYVMPPIDAFSYPDQVDGGWETLEGYQDRIFAKARVSSIVVVEDLKQVFLACGWEGDNQGGWFVATSFDTIHESIDWGQEQTSEIDKEFLSLIHEEESDFIRPLLCYGFKQENNGTTFLASNYPLGCKYRAIDSYTLKEGVLQWLVPHGGEDAFRMSCDMRDRGVSPEIIQKQGVEVLPDNGEGHVYFIEAVGSNQVKIGYSKNVKSRLRSLQTGSPFELILLGVVPGSMSLELDLHKEFDCYRQQGEWFSVSDEIISYVERNKAR